jgi:hypothetical protein
MRPPSQSPQCWYLAPGHRPAIGRCPAQCRGPLTHTERAADGARRAYCDEHAHWRQRTVRVPLLRPIASGERLDAETAGT